MYLILFCSKKSNFYFRPIYPDVFVCYNIAGNTKGVYLTHTPFYYCIYSIRILDFLGGATFMIEGTIQKVSNLIYLLTPKDVEIQNDVEKSQYKQKMSLSWLK